MDDWTYNPKRNPPPEGVIVDVRGSDCMGDWYSAAMRKDYKKPPPGTGKKAAKKAYRKGWRWTYESGDRFDDQAVEAWRLMSN